MRKIWLILVREYVENVRTKAFLIAVLMTPLLGALAILIPKWAAAQKVPQRTIALVDLTGELEQDVSLALQQKRAPSEGGAAPPLYSVHAIRPGGEAYETRESRFAAEHKVALDRSITAGEIFGYVVIRPSALTKKRSARATEVVTGNVVDITVLTHVSDAVNAAANAAYARKHALSPEVQEVLSTPAPVQSLRVGEDRTGTQARTIVPLIVMFVLFLTIVGTSQALITSTLEEKSSRVVEVLLSSVSPFQLMAGKVVGVCAVGLTLMTIWGAGGFAAVAAQGFLQYVDPGQLGLALVYYILGFLLIASLMVAVGSACNTLKEAQNLLSPLMIVLALPLMLLVLVMRDPNGPLATWLSFFPLFTPFLMMMRLGNAPGPPPEQVLASIGLLALSTAIAVWLASRVFRVGILLYGKPASVREIFRWMRSGA